MNEALLDVDTWRGLLTEDQRDRVRTWAAAEDVPIEHTYALVFGEGRVVVFEYHPWPPVMNAERTEALCRESVVHVRTPPPPDVVRVICSRTDDREYLTASLYSRGTLDEEGSA